MVLSTDDLKKILVGSGFIPEKDFDSAAKTATELGRELIDVLIFRGLINEETVGKLVSDHYGVPYVNIRRQQIDPKVLSLIPEKLARTYRAIPVSVVKDTLRVGMENPEDFEALEFLKRHTGLTIEPLYATRDDIGKALGQYKKGIKEDFDKIINENLKKTSAGDKRIWQKQLNKSPL